MFIKFLINTTEWSRDASAYCNWGLYRFLFFHASCKELWTHISRTSEANSRKLVLLHSDFLSYVTHNMDCCFLVHICLSCFLTENSFNSILTAHTLYNWNAAGISSRFVYLVLCVIYTFSPMFFLDLTTNSYSARFTVLPLDSLVFFHTCSWNYQLLSYVSLWYFLNH